MEYNTNTCNYDYIEDQDSAAVYQEAVPYHSTGPDVSKSTKTATKPDQSSSTDNKLPPSLYEAPAKQKIRVSDHTILTLYTYNTSSTLLGSK